MLVALSIVVLLGMAAVAIDAGRFLTQRRFVQNAADAAALAAANVVVSQSSTATVATARQAARDVLAIDLAGSPVGAPIFTAAEPPVFNGPQVAADLANGILLADATGTPLPDTASLDAVSDVRVALSGPVDFTFGRVVGVTSGTVSAQARVGFNGDLLPIAVRRYYSPPGPTSPALNPCPEPPNQNAFTDLASTIATSCTGQRDSTNPLGFDVRTHASPTSPGPTVTLIGQGAKADNSSSFRGYIALDVRNFQDQYSRVYFNGVTAGTSANMLKGLEATWIAKGYPGPGFPPVTSPADPNDQVAIMDGNSAGIVISGIKSRYNVGDRVLAAVYDGTVMTIPDFTAYAPTTLALTAGAAPKSLGTFGITKNAAFTGQVTLSMPGAPAWLGMSFTPNPATPATSVAITGASAAAGTPSQVATMWLMGQAGSPYLTAHFYPIAVNVGGVTRDYGISVSPDQAPAAWGDFVTYTVTVSTSNTTDFPAGISLGLDSSGTIYDALPAGSFWFNGVQGQTTATVAPGGCSHGTCTAAASLTINTTGLGAEATYPFIVTGTATNASSQQVARVAVGKVLASASADNSNYIDIIGFAVYQITAADSNSITGQAVSPIEATPDDPHLRAALTPRLIPWS